MVAVWGAESGVGMCILLGVMGNAFFLSLSSKQVIWLH